MKRLGVMWFDLCFKRLILPAVLKIRCREARAEARQLVSHSGNSQERVYAVVAVVGGLEKWLDPGSVWKVESNNLIKIGVLCTKKRSILCFFFLMLNLSNFEPLISRYLKGTRIIPGLVLLCRWFMEGACLSSPSIYLLMWNSPQYIAVHLDVRIIYRNKLKNKYFFMPLKLISTDSTLLNFLLLLCFGKCFSRNFFVSSIVKFIGM